MRGPFWFLLGLMGLLIAGGVVVRLIVAPVDSSLSPFWWGVIIGGVILLIGGYAQAVNRRKRPPS